MLCLKSTALKVDISPDEKKNPCLFLDVKNSLALPNFPPSLATLLKQGV